MSFFNLSKGVYVQLPGLQPGQSRNLKNTGSTTLFYGLTQNVSDVINEGSIPPNGVVTVTGAYYVICVAGPGQIDDEPNPLTGTGGGPGASAFSGLSDVSAWTPADGDSPVYNAGAAALEPRGPKESIVTGPLGVKGGNSTAAVAIPSPTGFAGFGIFRMVLNATCVATVAASNEGDQFTLEAIQDGTGGRGLTFAGATLAYPATPHTVIPTAGIENSYYFLADGSGGWRVYPLTFYGVQAGKVERVTATNAAYPIPVGAVGVRIRGVGASAGGGGGGSNAGAANNSGGGAGGVGATSEKTYPITASTTLNITRGAKGTGGAGGAAGGNVGIAGVKGGDTTVTSSDGINFVAKGGSGGAPGPATGTGTSGGGVMGAAAAQTAGAAFGAAGAIAQPGQGGANAQAGPGFATGGSPTGLAGGGGGGGANGTTTAGGNGGGAGTLIAGGAAGSGNTGVAAGGNGGSAAAGSRAGGGGGGGAPTGGAGGNGGDGDDGMLELEWLTALV